MGITDFINWVKSESRYDVGGALTNLPTSYILTAINARRKRIWRKADWPWTYTQLAFAVTPTVVVYTVTPKIVGQGIDRIRNIIPNDPLATPPVFGRALRQRTERQFYDEIRGCNQNIPDIPRVYLNLGQTAGVWKIQLWPGPQSSFTMGGSAKGILNTFLIGDVTGTAPFSAFNTGMVGNCPFDYWPDGVVEDVLFEGVMGDVAKIQGNDAEYARAEASFETKITLLAAEEADAAKDNTPITSPLPSIVRRRMGRRGYGYRRG